jgi:hypothetical protein
MISTFVRRVMLFWLVAIVSLAGSAAAQDYWMYPGQTNSLSLQVFKSDFAERLWWEDEGVDYGLLTSCWVMSARVRAADNVRVFVSLPLSNVVWELDDESGGLTLIGNPYFGLEIGAEDPEKVARPVGRIGIRPPVASDEKGAASFLAEQTLFNSFEGYFPKIWTLQLGMGTDLVSHGGITGSINVDVATMIPSEGDADSEIFGNYNLALMYGSDGFTGGFGLAGRIWMTEGDMDFGERTTHQLGFTGGYRIGSFQPGAHFRVPLDEDLRDYVDFIYGVSLTFNMN